MVAFGEGEEEEEERGGGKGRVGVADGPLGDILPGPVGGGIGTAPLCLGLACPPSPSGSSDPGGVFYQHTTYRHKLT